MQHLGILLGDLVEEGQLLLLPLPLRALLALRLLLQEAWQLLKRLQMLLGLLCKLLLNDL
jgi:hypothetical protein